MLLHGYGETGDMWVAAGAKLATDHTVIIPDLRGMGLSAKPSGGYDKKTQGHDIAGVLDALEIDEADLVTHDIGNMVGYAFAAEYPATRAPVRPHRCAAARASARGTTSSRATRSGTSRSGARTRSAWSPAASGSISTGSGTSSRPTRSAFPEASREHYAALYAQPGAMHAGFAQFKAFDQDAIDNKAFVAQGKLAMPVLAVGGEKSFGPMMATVMRVAATNVEAGHRARLGPLDRWRRIRRATVELVTGFLAK